MPRSSRRSKHKAPAPTAAPPATRPATQRKRKASAKASPAAPTRSPPKKRVKRKSNDAAPALDNPKSPTPALESYLEKLPDELLLHICSLVQGNPFIRRSVYYNLSLTSRRLNRTANDFLYEWFDARLDRPAKFLKTLIANPDLAARVRSITFQLSPVAKGPEEYQPTSSDCRMLRESLKNLEIKNRAAWMKDYSEGKPENLLRLATLHTPNLRNFCVLDETSDYPHYPHQYHVSQSASARKTLALLLNGVNGQPIGNAPAYRHLNSVHIRLAGMQIKDVRPIFRLPSLRKLYLQEANVCPNTDDEEDDGSAIDPTDTRFSTVTHLTVHESFIASSSLAELIVSCKELEEFDCLYSSIPFHGHVHQIDYAVIYRALRQHKGTLQVIDLDDVSSREIAALTSYERNHFDSFKSFTNLRVLGVPFEALPKISTPPPSQDLGEDEDLIFFHNLLPASLTNLNITVFEDEEVEMRCADSLEVFSDEFTETQPKISQIHVRVHRSVYMKCIDFSAAKAHWTEHGVLFSITQDGMDEDDIIFTEDEMGWDSEIEDYFDPYDYFSGEDFDDLDGEEDMLDAMQGDSQLLHHMMNHMFAGQTPAALGHSLDMLLAAGADHHGYDSDSESSSASASDDSD